MKMCFKGTFARYYCRYLDRPESRMIEQAFALLIQVEVLSAVFQNMNGKISCNPWIPHAKRYIGLTYPMWQQCNGS
jgi:hypothetical protein